MLAELMNIRWPFIWKPLESNSILFLATLAGGKMKSLPGCAWSNADNKRTA
ncbi:MAG: hypothetical protein JNL74_02810 [Fibrobacteres bacterium]|nr:hypothetical protein [Fibrobacterota bacterium]